MCDENRGGALLEQILSLDCAGPKAILDKEHHKKSQDWQPQPFWLSILVPWPDTLVGWTSMMSLSLMNLIANKIQNFVDILKVKITMRLLSFLVLKIPLVNTSSDVFFLGVKLL